MWNGTNFFKILKKIIPSEQSEPRYLRTQYPLCSEGSAMRLRFFVHLSQDDKEVS